MFRGQSIKGSAFPTASIPFAHRDLGARLGTPPIFDGAIRTIYLQGARSKSAEAFAADFTRLAPEEMGGGSAPGIWKFRCIQPLIAYKVSSRL